MSNAIKFLNSRQIRNNIKQALERPAVVLCRRAWESGYRSGMKLTNSRVLARKQARDASLLALPQLSGNQDIRDFIACVAFALAAGVFKKETCMKLLDAAELARYTMPPNQRVQ
jgi:hypothetical protein